MSEVQEAGKTVVLNAPEHAHADAFAARAAGSNVKAYRSASRILRTRWWVIVACLAGALGIAVVYLRLATRIYASNALVLVEQTTPSVTLDNLNQPTRFDNYLYTQAELIKTTPILGEVVKQPDVIRCRTLKGVSDRVSAVRGLLDCTVGKKNDIISISLCSPYPQEAAQLLNHVLRAYMEYRSRNTRNTASEMLKILKEARQTTSAELSESMAKVLEFRRTHGVLFLDNAQVNPITQRLATLSDELTKAELNRIQTKVSYESMRTVKADPAQVRELFRSLQSSSNGSDQERSSLVEALNTAEVRHAGLLQKLAPLNPQVQEAAAECQAARERLQKHDEQQVEAILAVVEQQYRAAQQREAELKAAMEKQRELAMDFNAKAVEYAMLDSDLKRKERLGEILESRIKDIDIRGDAGGLNIAVLEWANTPGRPAWPDKTRILGLAVLLGLASGIGLALVGEWRDDRIRLACDVTGLDGLEWLGEVPHIRRFGRTRFNHREHLEATEVYEELRETLCLPRSQDGHCTILMTSAAKGEGKSTTISGVAAAIARTGARALVVDADFLDPQQQAIFGVVPRPGLSELLSGETTLAEAIAAEVMPNLDLLCCGINPGGIPQCIRTGACVSLFELLSLNYDYVLVDSPPLSGSPDARVLAGACDRTVLVVRADRSTFEHTSRAQHTLRLAGIASLGLILNGSRRT